MSLERFKTKLNSKAAVLWAFTLRDFRGKYAASFMGVVWSVLNPLLLLAAFTFVFTAIFQIRLGPVPGFAHNALYIFCGILPWMAFQEATQRSATVLIENKNLVTRARFPSSVLPAAVVGSSLLSFLIGLCVLIAAVLIIDGHISSAALLVPLFIVLQILFALGVGWFMSSVNVFFRDLQQLLPVGLMVWMWGTPIFYSPQMVPAKLNLGGIEFDNARIFLTLNPMSHFIAVYRSLILEGSLPQTENIFYLVLFTALSLSVGWFCFKRGAPKFADVL